MTNPYEGYSSDPAFPETEQEQAPDVYAPSLEHEDEQADDASDKKSSRRRPARPTKLTSAQVRRVLSQATVIGEQDPAVRDLLAATFSTSTSVEDLVVATLSAPKAPADVIAELLTVAVEEDGFKPVILAHALVSDRDNARRTWAILTALGKVSGGIPAKDIQAATAVASAAKDLSIDDLAALELVTQLLG